MLPKEVAEKYKLVDWTGSHRQFFGSRYGTVDLKELTLRQADRLYRRGFPKLELKTSAASNSKPSKKQE